MRAVSAASGPSAASALSLETVASIDGDPSTSPDQCAPSAPFHCAAELSIQTVAAAEAHSIDAASSAACTERAIAALPLEAAGAASAKTVSAARLLMLDSPVFLHLPQRFSACEGFAPSFYLARNSQL